MLQKNRFLLQPHLVTSHPSLQSCVLFLALQWWGICLLSGNSLCRNAGRHQTLLGFKVPRPFSSFLPHLSWFLPQLLCFCLGFQVPHSSLTGSAFSPHTHGGALLSTRLLSVCPHFPLPHLCSLHTPLSHQTSCIPARVLVPQAISIFSVLRS